MFRRFSLDFAFLSILLDAISVDVALLLAAYFRVRLSVLPIVENIQEPVELPLPIYLIFPIIWVAVFVLFSVYDGRRNFRVTDEISSLTMGFLLASVSLAGVLYFSLRETSRFLFLSFLVLVFAFMLAWRLVIRLAFQHGLLQEVERRRILVIGAGSVGREFQKRVAGYRSLGLEVVGFLDDDSEKRAKDKEILGSLAEMQTIIRQESANDVVFALPRRAYERINQLVAELHSLPVKVWIIPDYFSLTLHRASVEEFAGLPMLDLRAPALTDYQRAIKRSSDVIITIALLPFILPAAGLIALAIRLDSAGQILFRQKRVGENGRTFVMYKFRTMVQNADELRDSVLKTDAQGHLIHKSLGDSRVTRVGRLLRRTSMDELPQFINVLKGQMSVVGPRPELPFLVQSYAPWQHKRFAIPPGITGWWQVSGRSDKPMHLHTEDDLYYLQNYSLFLDLWIMLKTVLVVLRGKGAY